MLDVKTILATAIQNKASDVHINAGLPPIMRINTELVPMPYPVITEDDAKQMVLEMIGHERFARFEAKRDYDFGTMLEDQSRFRVNAHWQRDTIAIAFRVIPSAVPEIETLHLPPVVKELTELPRGLVLVTGHTGSGKSTTLASMIGTINKKVDRHIITLEDPVEYVLRNDQSVIEQREIGSDCPAFDSGLKHALRQDPDIILVGEMRDLETTSSTMTAAETGHFVLSTLHTINAAQTVERIIDIYPSAQQNQIRTMVANTLQAVISQTLFRRIDEPGMVPCVEVLLCTSAVRNCIRENRIYEIPNVIETSRKIGMQLMDHSIAEMYFNGFIDREEGIARSTNPGKMEKILTPMPEGQAGRIDIGRHRRKDSYSLEEVLTS
jgi:twitching motility protein PilT